MWQCILNNTYCTLKYLFKKNNLLATTANNTWLMINTSIALSLLCTSLLKSWSRNKQSSFITPNAKTKNNKSDLYKTSISIYII